MHLVLDASVIYSEGFASSRSFRFLRSVADLLGHQIHVPALAIDEATAELEKNLDTELQQVRKTVRKWERILDKSLDPPICDLNPKEEANSLRNKLEDCESILDYPRTPHEKLAKRAINRTKPFDQKGSGYRDSLIWESVVELAATVPEQVVLLSSDDDFADDKKILAAELKADLVEKGMDGNKVVLVRSVKDFLNEHVRPELKEVLEEDPWEALTQLAMDPGETIAVSILDEYADKEWTGEDLDLPVEYETVHLSGVCDVENIETTDCREISPGQYLLHISATLDCEFIVCVHKANANVGNLKIELFEGDYVWGSIEREVQCDLDITIDLPHGQAPNLAVLSMKSSNPRTPGTH